MYCFVNYNITKNVYIIYFNKQYFLLKIYNYFTESGISYNLILL